MIKIRHTYSGSDDELIADLRDMYLPIVRKIALHPYMGKPNSEMNRDITEAEVRLAIRNLLPNSAPGQEQISNRAL